MRRLIVVLVVLLLTQYVLVPVIKGNLEVIVAAHGSNVCEALDEC
jgi:hypothetical protein